MKCGKKIAVSRAGVQACFFRVSLLVDLSELTNGTSIMHGGSLLYLLESLECIKFLDFHET